MDYQGPVEAALSTDLRGEPYNFSLWDIHTGTQLVVFKGIKGNTIPKCLQLVDNNYFITATDNVLNVWSIFNKRCQDQKLFLPGRPSVICVSPCGNYISVGIAEMIYVWQLHSGNLLAHTHRHYQTVSVLKMNNEGTFLVSGGEDGIVLVWAFADLISGTHHASALNVGQLRSDAGVNEPRFCFQHHSGQVTDIHLTNGGRCLTASTDSTINLYSYVEGKRLHCITMPSPIWSVAMNKNETRIFAGAQDGNIYETVVSSISLSLVNSRDKELDARPVFVGHKGKIVTLIVSMDGCKLVSASADSSCKIWDIHSKKLLQDIKHQAPLANLVNLLIPESLALTSMTQGQLRPLLSIKPLKRNVHKNPRDGSIMEEDLFEESSTTVIYIKNKSKIPQPIEQKLDLRQAKAPAEITPNELGVAAADSKSKAKGESVEVLKQRMRDLYEFAAEKIFRDCAHELLQRE